VAEVNLDKSEYLSERFENISLPATELRSVEFEECVFTGCDFSEATFRSCKFIDCHFVQCNLSLTRLDFSRFSDVEFKECKLVGVDWTKLDWSNLVIHSPLKFDECLINESSFFGLSLAELVLTKCRAHNVDFTEGDFSDADFSFTDFSNSTFNNTNLTRTDFTEATEYDIDVNFNTIRQARFSRYEAVRLLNSLEIELVD
jgi:uncharacterized protein YjbI with pentapeptide repeats